MKLSKSLKLLESLLPGLKLFKSSKLLKSFKPNQSKSNRTLPYDDVTFIKDFGFSDLPIVPSS